MQSKTSWLLYKIWYRCTGSKRVIQKTAEAAVDLIGNKVANKLQERQKLHHRISHK